MSGGPYGRGKAPERTCLPIDQWPAQDRVLWQSACTRGSLLDDDIGARFNHAAISNRKAEKGYGRWLTFLASQMPEELQKSATSRITRGQVARYVENLEALGNSTQTVLSRLQELGEAAKVMNDGTDISFISRFAATVRARHKPARDKTCRVLSHQLLELGVQLMEGAGSAGSLAGAVQYRDGLIIALLALVPLRRRNLADLVLGRSVVEVGEKVVVTFAEGETKTGAPLELLLPDLLIQPLQGYLKTWRPILSARQGRWTRVLGGALWVSKDGSPMTQMAIYDRVRARTRAAFGRPINPHAFRHAAATTQAIADPAHVRIAAPLLGHRTFTTTELYYQQATAQTAHRSFVEVIEALKDPNHD
jgi:integrase/recombinase XerD